MLLELDLRIAEDNTSNTSETAGETIRQHDISLGVDSETHLIPTLTTILIDVFGSVNFICRTTIS